MINFRYHVVSLAAIFLALAVGLVLGTAALSSTPTGATDDRAAALRSANRQYRDQVRQLTAAAGEQGDFDARLAPRALAGTLTGRSVLVVSLPGAGTGQVRGVQQMLGYAGATVTGAVRLTDEFTDPANADALGDLASTTLPVGIHQTLPDNGDGVESAAALLAAVLMTGTDTVSTSTRSTVLTAYATGRNLVVDKAVTGPAEAVVLVSGTPATGAAAADRNAAELTVVRQFADAGQAVLAGRGTAGTGNVLAATRRDGQLSGTVSTVDTVNLVRGQITTVLAVAAQLSGTVGHYGLGAGATGLLPADQ